MAIFEKVNMRKFNKEAKEKEQKRKAKRELSSAMLEIEKHRDKAFNIAKMCEKRALELAKQGKPDSIVDSYLLTSAKMEQFGMKLDMVAQKIQLAFLQSLALEDINNLVGVAGTCMTFFKKGFDFSAVGTKIADIIARMDEAMNEFFGEMDRIETPHTDIDDALGVNTHNAEAEKLFKDKKRELNFTLSKSFDPAPPVNADNVADSDEADHSAKDLLDLLGSMRGDGQ